MLTELQDLVSCNYTIVIFSNQAGISKGHVTLSDIQSKLSAVARAISVPCTVFFSTREDGYRKPCTGMWEYFLNKCNNSLCNRKSSIFVGDAAGRAAYVDIDGQHHNADFTCTDYMFSKNINLPFATPEEFFMNHPKQPCRLPWNIKTWYSEYIGSMNKPLLELLSCSDNNASPEIACPSDGLEAVLFVAAPASGKTSFYRHHFAPRGYIHVNKDTLYTQSRCESAIYDAFASGNSVVVDETLPTPAARQQYIDVIRSAARSAGHDDVIIRCFYFEVDRGLIKHLNSFRASRGGMHACVV